MSPEASSHFSAFLYTGDAPVGRHSWPWQLAGLQPAASASIGIPEPASPSVPLWIQSFVPLQVLASLPSPWNSNLLSYEYQFGSLSFFWTLPFITFLNLMPRHISDLVSIALERRNTRTIPHSASCPHFPWNSYILLNLPPYPTPINIYFFLQRWGDRSVCSLIREFKFEFKFFILMLIKEVTQLCFGLLEWPPSSYN